MSTEPNPSSLLGGRSEPAEPFEETSEEVLAPPPTTGETVTLSKEQFQELLSRAGVNGVTGATDITAFAKIIAEAMIEAKKPYVDPRQTANEESMRASMRDQEKRLRENTRRYQYDECSHIMGSHPLSDQADQFNRTAICWHRNDLGSIIGVCSVCQRLFVPSDPDYRQWRSRKSASRMSSAGQRQFVNPEYVPAMSGK